MNTTAAKVRDMKLGQYVIIPTTAWGTWSGRLIGSRALGPYARSGEFMATIEDDNGKVTEVRTSLDYTGYVVPEADLDTYHNEACRAHAIGCAAENIRDAGASVADMNLRAIAEGEGYLTDGTASCQCDGDHGPVVARSIELGRAVVAAEVRRTATPAPTSDRWMVSRPGVAATTGTYTQTEVYTIVCNAAVAHASSQRISPFDGAAIIEGSHEGSYTVDIIEYTLPGGWSVRAVREA